MQGLADALREQQGLADDSFQQLQREFRQGRSGQSGEGQPGAAGRQTRGRGGQSLADRQEALRQLMEELQRGLPGAAGEAAREALRDAERDMGGARDGLREGDTAGALDRQAEAIDNLREGMRQMGEDLRQAQQGRGGEQGQMDGQTRPPRTATTRSAGRSARAGAWAPNERMLPDGDSAARARELLDEIRRRVRRAEPPAARARLPAAAARPVLTGPPGPYSKPVTIGD